MEKTAAPTLPESGEKKGLHKVEPAEKNRELEAVLSARLTRIRVVGTGGAGNNTLTRLMEIGVKGIETIAVNTDAQDLLYAQAHDKILIGRNITSGLGAGSNPKIGEDSAKENLEELRGALQGSDLVFVTCGLGGGTGTGSAPVIAELARELGSLTIAVVTLPFTEEGIIRWENAKKGLERLRKGCDTVIVLQNDRLLELVPDLPLNSAFKVADEILVNAVKGITELVTEKGLVNLDFADVRAIMKDGGTALIGMAESDSENRALDAVERALQNPLLDLDINGAKSALINITGGPEMTLKEAKTIMKTVSERLDPAARVIWGARLDPSLGKTIRVMLIVTGLRPKGKGAAEIEKIIEDLQPKERQPAVYHEVRRLASEVQPEPKPAVPTERAGDGRHDGKTTKIFTEIFEEEARGDLNLLYEVIKRLGDKDGREKTLRDIKNACSSLSNAAQLFAFDKIAEFASLGEEVADKAISGKVELSPKLISLFKEVPDTIEGMIFNDPSAFSKSQGIIAQFRAVLNPAKTAPSPDPPEAPSAPSGDDGHAVEGRPRESAEQAVPSQRNEEGKKKLDTEIDVIGFEDLVDSEAHRFGKVDEAVSYVSKLFDSV